MPRELMEYKFRIRRFDPESGTAPRWEEFELRLRPSERVLDALIRIKETIDGTLTFRRSCAHGVCGSCAMLINGINALACQSLLMDLPQRITVEPLPALPVIKDLVVDMGEFFDKNDAVMPYLVNDEPPPGRERLQSPEDMQRTEEALTCVMCASCTSSCPSFWGDRRYLGPSALLKAYRFIFDSRDRAGRERMEKILGPHGLWRCHMIFNCVEACPKGIDITRHLMGLRRAALKKKPRP